MRKEYLEGGRIVSTKGLAGDVSVLPLGNGPDQLLSFTTLYLDDKGAAPICVTSARVQKNIAVLHLDGVDTVEAAQKLRDKILYFSRADYPLEEGVFFLCDLFGLSVFDADTNECYGVIEDVFQTGANDVYVIGKAGKQYLFPAAGNMIVSTDLEAGRLLIRPVKGIFDE